jgi:hypothetical protein
MYNVLRVVDLVKHFSILCQRHGLHDDDEKFPNDFSGIIKELER